PQHVRPLRADAAEGREVSADDQFRGAGVSPAVAPGCLTLLSFLFVLCHGPPHVHAPAPLCAGRAGRRPRTRALAAPDGDARRGALCETCDWELSTRLRRDGIATILEEVQQMRELDLFLIMRLRLELADGRTRQAVRTASLSLAMAHHAADQPTLINALVGVAL